MRLEKKVATLALLGQAWHAPHDRAVLMLVLSLPRRHLDQGLLEGVHGAQETLNSFDLAGATAKYILLLSQILCVV